MTRLNRLHTLLQTARLDAAALNPGPTLTWLTGLHFHLMERPVVLLAAASGETGIILPELETAKLEALPFAVHAFPYGEDPAGWAQAFRQAIQSLGLKQARIGVEPLRLRLLEYTYLQQAAPHAQFAPAGDTLSALRLYKDAEEIAAMRRAAQVAQEALRAALAAFRPRMTEKELAAELTLQLLRHGSEGEFPFPPIVSAGPNGANPHATPSDRPIREGDLLVIDWGARVDGYVSDITRTFAVGQVNEEARRIHQIVQQANAAGRAAARPGAACSAVDEAARQVIAAAGYGAFFTHRTGHGLGLEAHEPPWIRSDNAQPLAPGMAFTVEPGIYLPGRNGVRIEDDLIITPAGAESLTTLPRTLEVLS